jgi:hypothetical protein
MVLYHDEDSRFYEMLLIYQLLAILSSIQFSMKIFYFYFFSLNPLNHFQVTPIPNICFIFIESNHSSKLKNKYFNETISEFVILYFAIEAALYSSIKIIF